MVVGFVMASYSIVGNDAIQTLGTLLSSNAHRPWWLLWLFAGAVMVAVLTYGWLVHGDVSYGACRRYRFPTALPGSTARRRSCCSCSRVVASRSAPRS